MEKLEEIMGDFVDVSCDLKSLITTIENIDELYNLDNDEADLEAMILVTIRNLKSLHTDLRKSIDDLDRYIMSTKRDTMTNDSFL